MKKMKQRVATLLAVALMMSGMPVTAANAVLPVGTDGTDMVTDSGLPDGEGGEVKMAGVKTLSGQIGRDLSVIAERLAEELFAKITKDEIVEIVYRAENAFVEADLDDGTDGADGWKILQPFLEKEVRDYLTSVLEKAKEVYPDLNEEEVYRAVFDSMCGRVMEIIELFLKENDISVMSLLPLEEKEITVNLQGLTPVELTMVPFSKVFAGEDMTGVDEIAYVWRYDSYEWSDSYSDDYMIGKYPGNADLSRGTASDSTEWMMIPGGDQLNGRAKRYVVSVEHTNAREWLVPEVYVQNDAGNRTKVPVDDYDYSDYHRIMHIMMAEIPEEAYLKLNLNSSLYGASADRSSMKVYKGSYTTAEEAVKGTDITDIIYGNIDMGQKNAGYKFRINEMNEITIVSFDADGKATGCLPLSVFVGRHGKNFVSAGEMFEKVDSGREYVSYSSSGIRSADSLITMTYELYDGYAADDRYYFTMSYYTLNGNYDNRLVTAAYEGEYASIAAAQEAGAADIREKLFGTDYAAAGYEADYSNGVHFSVFVDADGDGQKAYHYCIKTKEGISPKSSGVGVTFRGLVDKDGKQVECYVVKPKDDSYAEGNYPVIMVEAGVDLTKLAPEFSTRTGVKLYAAGSGTPETSGESYHDFSKGPVHYTTASENGKNQKNVWLTVKQEQSASATYNLYTNSMEDSESDTRTEGGVIYSKREIILEHIMDKHDIFLINMGSNDIPKLSVELMSDVLALDEYWTLNGNHDLSAFSGVADTTRYGELANMAKVRLKMKDGVTSGEEITGILTVKADGVTIMVLELTGIAGAPVITTDSIPEAVKYVPYGTMIQNSNKYRKTMIKYALDWGTLPEGMELRENGELYGVPKETGTFRFRVKMASQNPNSVDTRNFTLEVKENTDENVDGATDSGYDVTQRIPTVAIGSAGSYDFVSQGILDEFTDVYLDGEKLVKDADYTAESGSTRLTIRSQTLTKANTVGTHTLGVEFRTTDENLLKRAAQNFNVVSEGTVIDKEDPGNGDSGNDSGSGAESGDGTSESGGSSYSDNSQAVSAAERAAAITASTTGDDSVILYTVSSGDTLWKIAEKFYGSGNYWQRVFSDNATVISNPDQIYAGQTLVIYSALTVSSAENRTGNKTYTIEAGDTLWKIAQKVYGKGWQWRKIYQANGDVISDPGQIRAGQILIIPEM